MKDRIINDMTPEQCFEQWNESCRNNKKETRDSFIKFLKKFKKIIHDAKISDNLSNIIKKSVDPYYAYFESIFEIIHIKTIDKEIINNAFKLYSESEKTKNKSAKDIITNSIAEQFNNIMDDIPDIKSLKSTIYKNLQTYFKNLTLNIIESAENEEFQKIIKKLTSKLNWVDTNMINFFSNYFKRNIYFISKDMNYLH